MTGGARGRPERMISIRMKQHGREPAAAQPAASACTRVCAAGTGGWAAGLVLLLAVAFAATPVRAGLGDPVPPPFFPLRSRFSFPSESSVLGQRAIEDEEQKKKKPTEEPPPDVPPATEEILPPPMAAVEAGPKSPTKAFLLSAALPGLGEVYANSNRAYIFMGIEAASWITFASYRASAGDKEDELYAYADRNFSIDAFEDNCIGQPGQPCQEALDQINNFSVNDRGEYYEIISKNPIYKSGWGVEVLADGSFVYENCRNAPGVCPPSESDEAEYRRWVADQASAQDRDYVAYNELRDDRNSLDSKARTATMVVLINHVVSAFDALMVARNFNAQLPQGVNVDFGLKASINNPGAKVTFRRAF